ncbi:MAG: hypothetical protein K2H64_05690 [Desulfovibrio sp.]|nr:hypothetical protein [Desulfovibrio sp.]
MGKSADFSAGIRSQIQPVATYPLLAEALKRELSRHTLSGPLTEVIYNRDYCYMSILDGQLTISGRDFLAAEIGDPASGLILNARRDLLLAWNKIAKGSSLTLPEELAIEMLWHEVIHTWQKKRSRSPSPKTAILLETVTEGSPDAPIPDFSRRLAPAQCIIKKL